MSTTINERAPERTTDHLAFAWTVRLLGISSGVVFWLVVATFPDFFIFNPWGSGDVVRGITLTLSSIGWILISVGPALLLWLYAGGRRDVISWLPVAALWWPISLLVSHITVLLQSGQWYAEYLLTFPIFIFTDIVLPLILMAAWWLLSPGARGGAR